MRTNTAKTVRLYESLRRTRPANKKDLKNYVKGFLHLDIPDKRICPDHNCPLDYLWHSFNADFAQKSECPSSVLRLLLTPIASSGPIEQAEKRNWLPLLLCSTASSNRIAKAESSQAQANRRFDCMNISSTSSKMVLKNSLQNPHEKKDAHLSTVQTSKSSHNRRRASEASIYKNSAAMKLSCSQRMFSTQQSLQPTAITTSPPRWKSSAQCTGPTA